MIMNRVDGQIPNDTTLGRQCRLPTAQTDVRGGRGERTEEREKERWSEKRYVCTKSDASGERRGDVEVGDNDNDQVCLS
jgi:hypothetical protein